MKIKLCILLTICTALSGCGSNAGISGSSDFAETPKESYFSEPPKPESSIYERFVSSLEEESESLPEDIGESTIEDEISEPSSKKDEIEPVSPSGSTASQSGAAKITASPEKENILSSPKAAFSEPAATQKEPSKTTSEAVLQADSSSYLSDVEVEVIALINAERASAGLSELSYDKSLVQAARIRSSEMFSGNFFGHKRKNGAGWETVLKEDIGVKYKSAGENLAIIEHSLPAGDPAYDSAYWYETWENSPSHYKNMVKPEFTHVGVGIYYGTRDGLKTAIATTVFASY